jgi:hypothetical protein
LDFLTCEIEFPDREEAEAFRASKLPADWPYLEDALDVTGHSAFGNRTVARNGFPAEDFAGIAAWLAQQTRPCD